MYALNPSGPVEPVGPKRLMERSIFQQRPLRVPDAEGNPGPDTGPEDDRRAGTHQRKHGHHRRRYDGRRDADRHTEGRFLHERGKP